MARALAHLLEALGYVFKVFHLVVYFEEFKSLNHKHVYFDVKVTLIIGLHKQIWSDEI